MKRDICSIVGWDQREWRKGNFVCRWWENLSLMLPERSLTRPYNGLTRHPGSCSECKMAIVLSTHSITLLPSSRCSHQHQHLTPNVGYLTLIPSGPLAVTLTLTANVGWRRFLIVRKRCVHWVGCVQHAGTLNKVRPLHTDTGLRNRQKDDSKPRSQRHLE